MSQSPRLALISGMTTIMAVTLTAWGQQTPTAADIHPVSTNVVTSPFISASSTTMNPHFALTKLASLTNYAFIFRMHNGPANAIKRGWVHTLTDWKTTIGPVTTYDIHGRGFSTVRGFSTISPVSFSTRQGASHLAGEYEAARGWIGMTHIADSRVTREGGCRVARMVGTLYDLRTPTPSAHILSLGAQACIANQSGALLAYALGVKSGSAAKDLKLTGATTAFIVTKVHNIPPITAPHS